MTQPWGMGNYEATPGVCCILSVHLGVGVNALWPAVLAGAPAALVLQQMQWPGRISAHQGMGMSAIWPVVLEGVYTALVLQIRSPKVSGEM
eukprot:1160753-Pelagomonas_calceolata.AAC.5